MTRYLLDKCLWEFARVGAFRDACRVDTAAAVSDRDLTSDERAAFVAGDIRTMFSLGAHPFLLYSYAIARNGGWSFELMSSYVAELQGLVPGDIET